jgi:hypothetical protein
MTRANADAEDKKPHQPATASTARHPSTAPSDRIAQVTVTDTTRPPAAGPGAKESQQATESAAQQDPELSQELWNAAYDILEKNESKLVESYVKTLVKVLVDEELEDLDAKRTIETVAAGACDISAKRKDLVSKILEELRDPKAKKTIDTSAAGASDVSTKLEKLRADISVELKDWTNQRLFIKQLVNKGQVKVAKASKITRGVGDVANAILGAKPVVDTVLLIPQAAPAALPWAGVCVGLQVSHRHFLSDLRVS